MGPRDPCNISGVPQAKYNKLRVDNAILVVHEESQWYCYNVPCVLWDKAELYVIALPTSYLVESGFSRVSQLLSKVCNRLDIVKGGDLRLSLTSMEPDIKKLAEQHQPQESHWINVPFSFLSNHALKLVY